MPKLQHEALTKWRDGEFVDDFSVPPEDPVTRIEDLPLEHQGEALTRAALERCSKKSVSKHPSERRVTSKPMPLTRPGAARCSRSATR